MVKIQKHKKFRSEILLIFILLFGLFLRLYFFIGLNWSDDVNYVDIANQILTGNYYPSYPNTLRLMLVFPFAFFFKLFGISNLSGALYPLICSLLSIVLAYYFGKMFFNKKVGLLAAFLLSFFPLDVNYSTWLMGDVPISLFTALSVFMFFIAEFKQKKYFFILAGFFTGLAYLIKPTGLLPLVFFAAYFVYKILKDRKIDFNFLYIFLGLAIILLIEGLFYYSKTGDFLLRFHKEFFYYTEKQRLVQELNTDFNFYPSIMFGPGNQYFGMFFFFVVFSMIILLLKKSRKASMLILWWLSFFLYMQYGTMSYKEYIPVHRLDRHLTVLAVPSVLILSCFLSDLLERRSGKKLLAFLIIVLILFPSLFSMEKIYSYQIASSADMKLIYNFLKDQPLKKVYTDGGATGHLRFYFGFQRDSYFKTIDWVKNCSEIKDSFVVLNATRAWLEWQPFYSQLPDCAVHPPSTWKLVKTIEYKTEVYPYKIFDPAIYYVA